MTTSDAAAAFERALEDCLQRVQAGEALDACLAAYPAELRPALADLLQAALRVRALPSAPSAAFQGRLEARLRAAVVGRRERGHGWRSFLGALTGPALRPVALAVAVFAVVTGTGVGVVQASDDSLPDSPLYAVKTVKEQMQLAVAPTGPEKQKVSLAQIPQQVRDLNRAATAGMSEGNLKQVVDRIVGSASTAVNTALQAELRGNLEPARKAEDALDKLQQQLSQLPDRPGVQELRRRLTEQQQLLKRPQRPTPQRPAQGQSLPPTARPSQGAGAGQFPAQQLAPGPLLPTGPRAGRTPTPSSRDGDDTSAAPATRPPAERRQTPERPERTPQPARTPATRPQATATPATRQRPPVTREPAARSTVTPVAPVPEQAEPARAVTPTPTARPPRLRPQASPTARPATPPPPTRTPQQPQAQPSPPVRTPERIREQTPVAPPAGPTPRPSTAPIQPSASPQTRR